MLLICVKYTLLIATYLRHNSASWPITTNHVRACATEIRTNSFNVLIDSCLSRMGEHSSVFLRTICDMDFIYGTFYKYVYNGKIV
jgi:hypothetical protein